MKHYENFPVASWLCPPALRAPILAIYHWARTADDLADEGDVPAAQRLADLAAYRSDLLAVFADQTPSARWAGLSGGLAHARRSHALPLQPLLDLLSAFEQDVHWRAAGLRYADEAALLDYCRRSANPVGRLMLHLYAVDDAQALAHSDAICSALQLINFWQDLGVDLARGRVYLSDAALARHGLSLADFSPSSDSAAARALVAACCAQARVLMQQGAPLALRLPGRAGWELRGVVQGGLRVLDRIEHMGWRSWQRRVVLRPLDAPLLLWRTLRMGAQ